MRGETSGPDKLRDETMCMFGLMPNVGLIKYGPAQKIGTKKYGPETE